MEMKEFTDALYELFVRHGRGLSESLLIMSRKPKADRVSRTAAFLYSALENGSLFSNALKSCSTTVFNDTYISFIHLAEKNGDLKSTVQYLKDKLSREADNRKRLLGASVYPVFVILTSISACIFIGIYTKTSDFLLLIKYIGALALICLGLYFIIRKLLGNSCLSESFMAVDFLVKSGIELSEAVACAVQISGPSSKTGRFLESAKTKLSYGMDLQNAFRAMDFSGCKQISEALYFADCGGDQNDIFGKMAEYLEDQKEKKRILCMSLIEPVFIVIAGAFLLLLVTSFFMPIINDSGWI